MLQRTFQTIDAKNLAIIASIEDNSIRNGLSNSISQITQLLDETKDYVRDPAVDDRVMQFFNYVNNSCVNKSTLIRRSIWMRDFANVVRNNLERFLYSQRVFSAESYNALQHKELEELTAKMVETMAKYRVRVPDGDGLGDHIDDLVKYVVDTVADLKPGQTTSYYSTATQHMQRIVERLQFALSHDTGAIAVMSAQHVYNELHWLKHRLRNYRNRIGTMH